jgi:small ligand-binding sensory domain FIST
VVQTAKSEIRWGSYVSSKPTVHDAVEEAVERISAGLSPDFAPDIALVFASCSYGQDLENVVSEIRKQLPSVKRIFGCSVSKPPPLAVAAACARLLAWGTSSEACATFRAD